MAPDQVGSACPKAAVLGPPPGHLTEGKQRSPALVQQGWLRWELVGESSAKKTPLMHRSPVGVHRCAVRIDDNVNSPSHGSPSLIVSRDAGRLHIITLSQSQERVVLGDRGLATDTPDCDAAPSAVKRLQLSSS